MADDFTAKKDYKLTTFTKNDAIIIKRIKEYSKRNCRKQIETSYITNVLNNFDFGYSFFRTEILNKDNTEKNRPCAFACIKYNEKNNNKTIFLMLICSIKNMDNLGSNILFNIFEHAKNKDFKYIRLECNRSVINFYKKHKFIEIEKLENDMISMIKTIE